MEKTIKIGEKEIRLNNATKWMLVYKKQFNRDILPTLVPLMAGGIDILNGLLNEVGLSEDIGVEDLAKVVNGDTFIDALIHIGSFEIVDLMEITWALAKTADEKLPDPETWIEGLETFPLDIVAPAVLTLIFKGVVSTKNLERLEDLRKRLQPELNSILSSLRDSKEA
jgi:hypothetical protein